MLKLVSRMIGKTVKALGIAAVLCAGIAWASVGGSIAGTVQDPAGRVIAKAGVTAREMNTGLEYVTHTDAKGAYSFPVLPVGRYELEIKANGFRGSQRTGIALDTSAALTLDATLAVGDVAETVSVMDDALHVETTSTQLGEVISARQMTAWPLDGRSYTDLLSTQAGVAPMTSITSTTVQDVGATVLDPSGVLNPGTISIHGQREFANYFSVNGADVEEDVNAGTAILPNLDSIAEFRIITSNFDAEYGEFSGGQINVITKSGTNKFHGDAFDFLRNTAPGIISRLRVVRFGRTSLVERLVGRCARIRFSSSRITRERGRRRESTPALSACRRMRTAAAICWTLRIRRLAINSRAWWAGLTSRTCCRRSWGTR